MAYQQSTCYGTKSRQNYLYTQTAVQWQSTWIDGIPTEVYKLGGQKLVRRLTVLFNNIGNKDAVPQDFKDANIIHLYKKQGTLPFCDNHHGISVLITDDKVLSKIIANRPSAEIAEKLLPDSQCGF